MVFDQLRGRRAQIIQTWTTLLGAEPVASPLAEPNLLACLFDPTLDRIFKRLQRPAGEPIPAPFQCACGLSPYLAFFRSVEQALLEALVQVHRGSASALSPAMRARDLADLRSVIRSVGNKEIALFGSVCQKRGRCRSVGQCPLANVVADNPADADPLAELRR